MAKTDPARELAITLEQLTNYPDVNANVDRVIAHIARVDEWSENFFRVLFEIVSRCKIVENEIERLALDDDVKEDALQSIRRIYYYLNQKAIVNQNIAQAKNVIGGQNITILKMLSSQIRVNNFYEAIDAAQKESVLTDVRELISWLREQQDIETDFIRSALIEGLESFEFRLDRLEWFGSGYAIEGLKDVIHAYLAIQGSRTEVSNGDELINAILLKTKALLKTVSSTFDLAKDTTERAGWALQIYGTASAIRDGSQTISGLLGN